MKRTSLVFASLLALVCVRSHATTVTLNLEAAQLLTSGSITIPNGCLIQLLGDTSTTFGAPTSSSFTGTDPNEVVLASFAMDSSTVGVAGDFKEPIILTLTGTGFPPDAESDLLLRWYPTLTTSSSTPGSGTSYGQFRTDSIENGSNIAWVLPASGTKALNFVTISQGGTEPNSAGVANLIIGAIPEPSTVSFAFAALALLAPALRRRRS
jgi:MYXO-CTERM domain-containing protein